MDKVKQVSEHVNMILRYIPYIQTNFVLGLDGDMGPEPFELTKKFIDLSPGAFPGLLAALRVRPRRADESRVPARRPGAAVPVPFPEQQPRDERPAQELLAGPSSTTASSTSPATRSPGARSPAASPPPRPLSPSG